MRILIVDDEEIVRQTIGDYLSQAGLVVEVANDGQSGLERIKASDYDLALIDLRMPGIDGITLLREIREVKPDLSVVIITGHGNMEAAIQALRLGAIDFLTKPIKLLELDAMLEKSSRLFELRRDKQRLKETIGGIQTLEYLRNRNRRLIGTSRTTQDVRRQIKLSAEADCDTILISGETGSGKEVAAREIHFLAEEEDSPFIAVSCPALPDSLVESELFGHVKGAYTGATDVRTRKFRRDLYYRLNVYSIHMQPLRKRREDIMLLAEHFLKGFGERKGTQYEGFSPEVRDLLINYDFPGNARELRNLVDHAAILARSGQIQAEHLCLPRNSATPATAPCARPDEDFERERILKALAEAKWNRRETAKNLGMTYATLRYRMKRYQIQ
jgi:DNA-binding NtrC family response regulator